MKKDLFVLLLDKTIAIYSLSDFQLYLYIYFPICNRICICICISTRICEMFILKTGWGLGFRPGDEKPYIHFPICKADNPACNIAACVVLVLCSISANQKGENKGDVEKQTPLSCLTLNSQLLHFSSESKSLQPFFLPPSNWRRR